MIKDAEFWEKHDDKIRCLLCPHSCVIARGKSGLCSVRTNVNDVLRTINYGEITAIAMDPIEKKPLYRFEPGRKILSVGSFGCNFYCDFCQNYSIAHYSAESRYISPDELAELCSSMEDNIGLAFTYNEPSIWYEYVYDASRLLKERYPEFKAVLVTNGYIQTEPLLKLLPYVDAMNIDLKAFNKGYYKNICGGDIEHVKRTIEESHDKCHVEITTLLVSGLNDSPEEVASIASYLASLDRDIPLHLSRYFPTYKMTLPPTDIDVMLKSRDIARQYLNHVYLGNM